MPLVRNDSLAVIISNRIPGNSAPLDIRIEGARFENTIKVFELAGDSFMARNGLLHPKRVSPRVKTIKVDDPRLVSHHNAPRFTRYTDTATKGIIRGFTLYE